MIDLLPPSGERVLAALGNGAAHGIVVGLAAWLALRLLRRGNAATRHLVGFAALMLVGALPILHFLIPPAATTSTDGSREPTPGWVAIEATASPVDPNSTWIEREMDAAGLSADAPSRTVAEPRLSSPDPTSSPAPVGDWFFREPRTLAHGLALHVPPTLVTGLLAGWALIALIRLGILGAQLVALRRLKSAAEAPPAHLLEAFSALRRELLPGRAVGIGISPEIESPIAAGFLHPMVLLPASLVPAPAEAWDPVLRHEMAHLARRDDLTNLLQQAIHAVLFFHPVVHWLGRRLTLDREIACDDHVLAARGNARDYALFLTDFAHRTQGRSWSAAPGAWSNPSQLRERIHMILDTQRNASPRPATAGAGTWIAAVILLATLGLLAAPRLAIAADSADDGLSATPAAVAPEPPTVSPPAPPAPPSAASLPATPASADRPEKAEDGSVQERLERLERLVESLAQREKTAARLRAPHPADKARIEVFHQETDLLGEEGADKDVLTHVKPGTSLALVKPKADVRVHRMTGSPDEERMEHLMAEVHTQMERATQDAQRAMEQALRSVDRQQEMKGLRRDLEARRRALDAERRSLEKQIARLEAQLDEMDRTADTLERRVEEKVERIEKTEPRRIRKPVPTLELETTAPAVKSKDTSGDSAGTVPRAGAATLR